MVPSTLVFKHLILVLDLGFLLLPCCHFYKPVVSATGDVHTFQEEEGARKVSTDGEVWPLEDASSQSLMDQNAWLEMTSGEAILRAGFSGQFQYFWTY